MMSAEYSARMEPLRAGPTMPRGNPEDGVEGKVLRNLYSEGMILEADRIDHLTVGP